MVKLEHLKKHYDGFDLDISLSLEPGMVTGIVGRNGAGKSTTIKALLGLIKKDSGTVEVLGKDSFLLSNSDKERMGVALSESGFSGYLTVNGVVKILGSMYRNFDKEFFMRTAKEQGLPMNKAIKDFSTGMRAKLRVLSAVSHKAELLILDEPTAGLDVVAREDILDILRAYMEEDENRAILITSHISSDLEGLCDDIYMIHKGKVVLHEDTDILLGNYAVLKVSDSEYETIDKEYIVKEKKTKYGYSLLTNEKQYYVENFRDIVIENGTIDDLILMIAGKED